MAVIFLPTLLMPTKYVLIACKLWAKLVVYGAKYIAQIDFEIKGTPPTKPCIIASKHQSAWETAFFWLAVKNPCFVLKKELMYLPLFGLYLFFSQQIWVNRSKGASAIKKLLPQVTQRLAEERTIIIFPEGTRTLPHAKASYKTGIALLYSQQSAPIIPVRLNSGECWGKNSFWKKSGIITVEFLPAIPRGLAKIEFMQELQKRIETGI